MNNLIAKYFKWHFLLEKASMKANRCARITHFACFFVFIFFKERSLRFSALKPISSEDSIHTLDTNQIRRWLIFLFFDRGAAE